MVLATSEAFTKTFGLIVTFGGIGLVVNAIILYIIAQVRSEREQNRKHLGSSQQPPS